jgi:coenzyme F420-reducing hydrogenase delta subunit/cytochrome c2
MEVRKDNRRHKYIAKIDPDLCVACGICIGTCAPLAMSFGDIPVNTVGENTIPHLFVNKPTKNIKVVFTCERHVQHGLIENHLGKSILQDNDGHLIQVIPMTCIGMVHPNLAAKALDLGASEVHFIGCPPEDCPNREGNIWMKERIDRKRLPKLKSGYQNTSIKSDWLPPIDFSKAINNPNTKIEATSYNPPKKHIKWRRFLPALILTGGIVITQVFLSNISIQPFKNEYARLEIILDHQSGNPLMNIPTNLDTQIDLNFPTRLVLMIDEETIFDKIYPPQGSSSVSLGYEQIPIKPGKQRIQIVMYDRPKQTEGLVLYDQTRSFHSNEIFRLTYKTQQIGGNPLAGKEIFNDRSIGSTGSCNVCHSVQKDVILVGPSLAGIANTAAQRIPEMTAEEYLRESIVSPDAYIVEGYPPGQMLADFGENLSSKEIDNLISYLLTLK